MPLALGSIVDGLAMARDQRATRPGLHSATDLGDAHLLSPPVSYTISEEDRAALCLHQDSATSGRYAYQRSGTRPAVVPPVDRPTVQQILVVDDEPQLVEVMGRYLRRLGYEVHLAGTAGQALELVRRHKFVAMVCDVGLPGISGTELVRCALLDEPHLAIVMCTGANDAATAKAAMARGAADYLVKPVPLAELGASIERALVRRQGMIEQEEGDRQARDLLSNRTEELMAERSALQALTAGVAEALVNAMEQKDVFLRGHSQRVAQLAGEIAVAMELDAATVAAVQLGGRLHDVGKIGIREAVLHKPGRLSEEEYAHVKEHVAIGMEILAPLPNLWPALEFVHHHHERVDGSGYPQGLRGEAISIGGRILAVADTFDALTSIRPYRERLGETEALAVLGGMTGTMLDETVYAALEQVVRDRRARWLAPFAADVPDTLFMQMAS